MNINKLRPSEEFSNYALVKNFLFNYRAGGQLGMYVWSYRSS